NLQVKFHEMAAAVALTRDYSKDQILSWYLNSVFYGNESYGIEAAAVRYFGKTAAELNLAEASFLAGLPNSPATYDAYTAFDAARARQQEVLSLMVAHNYVSQEDADAAFDQELVVRPQDDYEMRAPYF